MKIWATDVGNAYLDAKTRERVYIATVEFGAIESHILLVRKTCMAVSDLVRYGEKDAQRYFEVSVSIQAGLKMISGYVIRENIMSTLHDTWMTLPLYPKTHNLLSAYLPKNKD